MVARARLQVEEAGCFVNHLAGANRTASKPEQEHDGTKYTTDIEDHQE